MSRSPLSLWLFGATALCAALIGGARAERLPVKIFTSADGLGSSFVNDLMTDSRGFLWLSTRDGLSRFDGNRFITYQIGKKDSPPGIESLYETRNGDYWVTTTSGLYRLRPNIPSLGGALQLATRPVLAAEFITGHRGVILEDRQGQLWFGSAGFFRLQEENGKVNLAAVPINLPPDRAGFSVSDLAEAPDGSIWLNTTTGLICQLPDGRIVFYRQEIVANQSNISLLVDSGGRIWVSRLRDLDVFMPESVESFSAAGPLTIRDLPLATGATARTGQAIKLPTVPGDILHFRGDVLTQFPLRKLYQTRDGRVWITTEKELLEFDGVTFHRYTQAQGLLPSMSHMTEDVAGNLWIGGQTGLIRFDRQGMRSYGETEGLNSSTIHAISQAPDGSIFAANGDYFLSRFNGRDFSTQRLGVANNALYHWTSRFTSIDRNGDVWALTREKIYRFARTDLTRPAATFTDRDGLIANEAFQIYEDRSGNIWISHRTVRMPRHGISWLPAGSNRFQSISTADGYPTKTASSIGQDGAGNLWLGFYEEGIARYRNGQFVEFSVAEGVPKGLITDLHLDRAGRLWLASSSGGVGRIDDPLAEKPVISTFTVNEGLSSNNIRTLTEDQQGNIYLGTVRGVDRISADGLRIKHYSVNDGLAGDFVVDSMCDRQGVLWFATTNGLSRLVPTADGPTSPPAVWLAAVRIAGVAEPIADLGQTALTRTDLEQGQNSLQIDFFGLDFRPGERLRYQYMLEGVDRSWSPPSEQQTVTLANLRPGSYRFLVRAVNSNGVVSPQNAVVSFNILPPFWLRWWFIALVSLVIAGAVVMVYRYRIARLREVNTALHAAHRAAEGLRLAKEERLAELERVRSRIATDLHDDIGASLTQIAILSEVAQQQNSSLNGKASGPLEMIYSVSNELVGTMSDIVWAINPHKDHLPDLTQRMRRFASDVLSTKEIDFEFTAPPPEVNLAVGANVRREVFLIFKEAINNIIKHARATEVIILFEIDGTALRLTIADNGEGFAARQPEASSNENLYAGQQGGNGLFSIRRRAQELGGELSIRSGAGQGTALTLLIPIVLPAGGLPGPTQSGSDGGTATTLD